MVTFFSVLLYTCTMHMVKPAQMSMTMVSVGKPVSSSYEFDSAVLKLTSLPIYLESSCRLRTPFQMCSA